MVAAQLVTIMTPQIATAQVSVYGTVMLLGERAAQLYCMCGRSPKSVVMPQRIAYACSLPFLHLLPLRLGGQCLLGLLLGAERRIAAQVGVHPALGALAAGRVEQRVGLVVGGHSCSLLSRASD